MATYYSKLTNGFYCDEIHAGNMPADAVEISDQTHTDLLAAQSSGSKITANAAGHPIAVQPTVSPNDAIKAQIAQLETAVTPRMVQEALAGASNVFPAGSPYGGMTSAQAIDAIVARKATLRSQLS